MQYILLLAILGGCAMSTDQLHEAAMGCGTELNIESNGIVRTPTEQEKEEQCKPVWAEYNKRADIIFKRQENKRHERERLEADRARCGGRPPIYQHGRLWGCF